MSPAVVFRVSAPVPAFTPVNPRPLTSAPVTARVRASVRLKPVPVRNAPSVPIRLATGEARVPKVVDPTDDPVKTPPVTVPPVWSIAPAETRVMICDPVACPTVIVVSRSMSPAVVFRVSAPVPAFTPVNPRPLTSAPVTARVRASVRLKPVPVWNVASVPIRLATGDARVPSVVEPTDDPVSSPPVRVPPVWSIAPAETRVMI